MTKLSNVFRVFRGPYFHSGTPSGVLTMVGGVPGVVTRQARSTPGYWLSALRAGGSAESSAP